MAARSAAPCLATVSELGLTRAFTYSPVVRPQVPFIAILATLLISLVALPAVAGHLSSAVSSARGSTLPTLNQAQSMATASARAQAAAEKPFHSDLTPIIGACDSAGEVVGMGPNVEMIFQEFAKSSVHWSVITSSKWTSMGAAATRGNDGYLYVSVIFCEGDTPPPSSGPTTTTTHAPIIQPISRAVSTSLRVIPVDREICPLITGDEGPVDMGDSFCII